MILNKLSKKQRELIIGCLLGDGRLESRSCFNTARFRIHHADSQKEYLFWKFRLLRSLTSSIPRRHEYVDKRNNKRVTSWYFHTRTLVSLRNLYLKFYKNGKKVLPRDLSDLLTPFVLATWIMDDGSWCRKSLVVNSQSFSRKEHDFLCRIFREKFEIKVGVQKDRKNIRLYFAIPATRQILKIIAPFVLGSKFIPVETDPRSFSTSLVR